MYTKDFSDTEKKELRDSIKVSDDHLKVAEIFTTIQGEGPNTGIPVVFIRLSLCNLQCTWCDTPYTWNWEGTPFRHDTKDYEQVKYDPRKEIIEMVPGEIYSKVKKLARDSISHVVLTGGEPLVQQKSSAFLRMLELLVDEGDFEVEVETNGTIVPSDKVQKYITQFNVSPKLENSGNTVQARRRNRGYEFYTNSSNAFFKFVVTSKNDITEIEELVDMYKIPLDKVLLMPEGRTNEEMRSKAQELIALCIKKGYRFCNRLQVWAWDGALRGV